MDSGNDVLEKYKIRKRIQELCRENPPNNQFSIKQRNEKIIQQIMKEFGISRENAEYHFKHNKDLN